MERRAPKLCAVTVTYTYAVGQGEGATGERSPQEEESERALAAWRPYGEHLDLVGQSKEVGTSPINGLPIGIGDSKVTVYNPQLTWSFKAKVQPLPEYFWYIGCTNSEPYPPPNAASDHWQFAAHSLLFVGASGDRSGDTQNYSNLWDLSFTFLWSPFDWRYEPWNPTTKVEMESVDPTGVYYIDPFARAAVIKRFWDEGLGHEADGQSRYCFEAVSYTHLTLPTN